MVDLPRCAYRQNFGHVRKSQTARCVLIIYTFNSNRNPRRACICYQRKRDLLSLYTTRVKAYLRLAPSRQETRVRDFPQHGVLEHLTPLPRTPANNFFRVLPSSLIANGVLQHTPLLPWVNLANTRSPTAPSKKNKAVNSPHLRRRTRTLAKSQLSHSSIRDDCPTPTHRVIHSAPRSTSPTKTNTSH